MFEFFGYVLVVLLLGVGLYYVAGQIEEASVRNEGDKSVILAFVFLVGIVLIFLSGLHLGGSGEREKADREEIVKVEKEIWNKEVKGKFEAYSSAFAKKKSELSVVSNNLVRVEGQLEKTKGYMVSNMVPRYVVAPIVGEVGGFHYSNIFPIIPEFKTLEKSEKSENSEKEVKEDIEVEPVAEKVSKIQAYSGLVSCL